MEQAPAAPAASEAVPAPAATPGADSLPSIETPAKPDRTFTQSELDEILKKKDAKRLRERDELRRENEVLRKLALERAAAREEKLDEPQRQQQPKGDSEPTRDQYASYEEFIEARAEWRADQRVDKKLAERETQDRERQTQSEQEKKRAEFRKQMKESAKDIEDFDEVIANIKPDDPVANVSASAIEAADQPGKVLHYLATNPEEAERIASLSMGKQAREIVRLEEKLAKPPVKPSKAPEPISPVGGKATVGDEMPDPKTQPEKWMKWRQAQVRAQKTGVRA